MKFTCTKQNLARGLTTVGHAISAKNALPIISNVKLETQEGHVCLSATNLELGIECLVEAEILEAGSTTLPAKVLDSFVDFLPHETITITTNNDTHESVVESAISRAMIKGADPLEFPTFPRGDHLDPFTIETAMLKEMIAAVAFAASTDANRPNLTAIFLEVKENTITCAAADSFRLAVVETPRTGENVLPELLIPAKTLKEIAGILPIQGEVTIGVTQNQVFFRTETLHLVCRILDGKYVNFRLMLPDDHTVRAVLETHLFGPVIKTAALFAGSDNSVKLTFRPAEGTVTVEARTDYLGTNTTKIRANFSDGADELSILFNARYLAEALTAIGGTPEFAFELRTRNHPGIIKPIGSKKVTYLLMPLQITANTVTTATA